MSTVAGFWDAIADQLDPDAEGDTTGLPADWHGWLKSMFPASVKKPFGDHHVEFWEWVWQLRRGIRPRPFVGIWPRGGGKSTAGELAVSALGALDRRRYVVYVSETQDQSDKRVDNIGTLLESESIAAFYPALGRRATGKHGRSKAWRRNRLWTSAGFIVDGLGLDTAARGLKVEEQRPDLIVLDDLDGRHDTKKTTARKIATLTDTILPMGSDDLAVLALQNLIIATGIFGQIASGEAEFLIDRHVSGPTPAIFDLKTKAEVEEDGRVRQVIVGGTPSWPGQGTEECQGLIDTTSLSAFLREQQHEVDSVEGALWSRELLRHIAAAPRLKRIVIGIDPSGGKAEIGIVAAGIGYDGRGYVLADNTQPGRLGPNNWGRKSIALYERLKADRLVAEKNFGGDMVESTIRVAAGGSGRVPVYMVTSSRGKAIRAEPVVALYEQGLIDHVGSFPEMEVEMTRWIPGEGESPNRLDALVFALTELFLPGPRVRSGASSLVGGM